ncbi:MAG: antibiotic biosynthesis monooxygenase family protein [Gammaproteobacteria bacterium]
MACQVLLEATIKEGCHDRLRARFVELLPDTRGFDGCIYLYIVKDQDDPTKIIIVELWESRAHYEKYLAWRTETGIMDELAMMLDNPSWRFLDNWGV